MRRFRPRDEPDAIWHVTGRVNWRVWHLESEQAFAIFLSHMRDVLERFCLELFSFVVMSNHYHLVLRCPAAATFRRLTGRRTACRHFRSWPRRHPNSSVIGQCVRRLTLGVSKSLLESLGLSGRFWQGRHHRRKIRDEWCLLVAMAYDHRNPVRAGIVRHASEFQRSSAGWWEQTGECPLPLLDRGELPFSIDLEQFRDRLLAFQEERRLDDVMQAFAKTRMRWDSPDGYETLRALMEEEGLDPLTCGTRAAV